MSFWTKYIARQFFDKKLRGVHTDPFFKSCFDTTRVDRFGYSNHSFGGSPKLIFELRDDFSTLKVFSQMSLMTLYSFDTGAQMRLVGLPRSLKPKAGSYCDTHYLVDTGYKNYFKSFATSETQIDEIYALPPFFAGTIREWNSLCKKFQVNDPEYL